MQVGANRAFELLYRQHRAELYRWLLRETGDPDIAEDVLQTAFMQAYSALLRGNPPREPRPWLFAIARNANRLRFRQRRVVETELDEDLPMSRDESLVSDIREALAVLPPSQRAAIVLQEVGGLSYAEIGERLGVTTGAVQMLVFRARRRLRNELLGAPRLTRLLLPLQPVLNALSRMGGAGDRALLLRGAAGLAGAVAIGGSVMATPGDASPRAASVRAAAVQAVDVRAPVAHAAARARRPALIASPATATMRPSIPAPAVRPTRVVAAGHSAHERPRAPATTGPAAEPEPTPASRTEPVAEPSGTAQIAGRAPVPATVTSTVSDAVDTVTDAAGTVPVPPVPVPDVTVPALATPPPLPEPPALPTTPPAPPLPSIPLPDAPLAAP